MLVGFRCPVLTPVPPVSPGTLSAVAVPAGVVPALQAVGGGGGGALQWRVGIRVGVRTTLLPDNGDRRIGGENGVFGVLGDSRLKHNLESLRGLLNPPFVGEWGCDRWIFGSRCL